MNTSAQISSTQAGHTAFSFRRLGQLLQLDFAFHHRQWVQILIAGLFAACVPVVVVVLTTLLFGNGGDLHTARGVLFSCLYFSLLAVTVGTMISYNKRVNAPLSPLYMQIPASATEKYLSLLILTAVLHLLTPILGLIAWTLYMLLWALLGGASVLAYYSEILSTPWGHYNLLLGDLWGINLLIASQLASYATYLFCIISAHKPMRAILRYLSIGFGIFVLCMLGLITTINLMDISSIDMDESNRYILLELEEGTLGIPTAVIPLPVYLYAIAMVWLGYRSLQRKQVKA